MASIPVLLKVARFEDGVVQQTMIEEDGAVSETFFKRRESSVEEFEMGSIDLTSHHTVNRNCVSTQCNGSSTGVRVESKVMVFLISLLIDIILTCYLAWIVNPFWIDEIFPYPALGDPSQVPRQFLDVRQGCQADSFCWAYHPPFIRTPVGTFYPNFTTDSGRTVNYTDAMVRALSIMANESCIDYRVISLTDGTIVGSERASPNFDATRYSMQWAVLMLSHECHPEISLALSTPNMFRRWGLTDYRTFLPSPAPGPCVLNWTDLYSTSIERTRKTTVCSGRLSYSDVASVDSGDYIVFE